MGCGIFIRVPHPLVPTFCGGNPHSPSGSPLRDPEFHRFLRVPDPLVRTALLRRP